MELSQMVVQARWTFDSFLKQLPHLDDACIKRCQEAEVDDIFKLMELEDDVRGKLLQLPNSKLRDVAVVCNRYPNIDVEYEVVDESELSTSSPVKINVRLDRDLDEGEKLGPCTAPFYPTEKAEGWWLVVGDPSKNILLSVKRVSFVRNAVSKLDFNITEPGEHNLTLYLMCDCYSGCDQEFKFKVNVVKGEEEEEDDEDAMSE